ncbi:MAG TPA: LytTR family DNA-binding domain-containing protein, partial [Bacteroidia bacterium]|nr:LytTR family DNA-binding domain-containing protein [Bacteroidia bacterium]
MNTIIIDDDELSGKLIEQFITRTGFVKLCGVFTDPVKAISFLVSNKIDLVFLDIEMPVMNGIEFMSNLKSSTPQIIIVTSHKEFAIDAFEFNVVDYLVKPLYYPRFFSAVNAAKTVIDQQEKNNPDNDIVFVKKDNQMIRIRKSDILWVEALGDYSVLYTAKEKFVLHCTLKAVEDKLPEQSYLRVHRS